MITPPSDVRIVLVAEPVDFRKGPDSLARLVEQHLQAHPFGGDLYIFRAKRKDRIKIVGHDGTGLWIVHRRWGHPDINVLNQVFGTPISVGTPR